MTQFIPPESLTDPDYKRLLQQCIHCGLCLPACPTYAVFGTEMDAPRGRIALMRAASDGRIGLEGAFEEHISLCLSCRACETPVLLAYSMGRSLRPPALRWRKPTRPAYSNVLYAG